MTNLAEILEWIETHSDLIQAVGVIVGGVIFVVGWINRAPLARVFHRLYGHARRKLRPPKPKDQAIGSTASVEYSPQGVAISGSTVGDVHVGDTHVHVAPPPTPPPPPPPDTIPAPTADFVGRQEEQAKLLAALRGGGRASICAIGGMGGIGKTELARRVAHALERSGSYPGGHVLVEMQGTSETPLPPEQAMRAILQEFDHEARLPAELGELAPLYRRGLTGKRVLLVLDNAKDHSQVAPLLPPEPCGLIVTSRNAIRLDGGEFIHLKQLKPEHARALLAALTRERAFGAAELDALAGRCGYLPLALRAAGTFLATHDDWPLDTYLGELASEKTRLARLTVPEGDIDVEATLGLSAAQLQRGDAALYERWRMLAVFPAPFIHAAAMDVWKVEETAAIDGLSKLHVNYSLVLWERESGRYRLHDLMRDVALRRAEAEGAELTGAGRRHAAHYIQVLAAADRPFLDKDRETQLRGLALFDQERRHIEAGRAWAAAHARQDDLATHLANDYPNAGAHVLSLRLHHREWAAWLQDAAKAARALGDKKGEGNHLGNLGTAHAVLGEPRRAIEYYQQALAIAREIGDRRMKGNALGNLGNAHAALGDSRRAIEYYQQALAISREIGDRRGEGNHLGNLGTAHADLGEPRRAIEYHEQALAIAREIGDPRMEGNALGNLGTAHADLGDPSRAIEYHQQALAVSRKIGDRCGEGNDLGNLGNAFAALGDPRRAIEYHEQALAISRETGDRRGEGSDLGNLGNAHAALGEPRRAIEYFQQALAIAREIGDRHGGGNRLGNLGNCYAELGDPRRAIEYHEQALAISREIGDRRGEGTHLWNLALRWHELGDRPRAIALARESLRIWEAIEDPRAERVWAALAEWEG